MKSIAIPMLAMALLLGCATRSADPDVYPRGAVRQPYHVQQGTVLHVESVRIEGEASAIGTLGGYIVGDAVGDDVADSNVASAVGGVAGAIAGGAIEKAVTGEAALRITVEMSNGDILAIVQSDDLAFRPGDAVRVLTTRGGEARVVNPI